MKKDLRIAVFLVAACGCIVFSKHAIYRCSGSETKPFVAPKVIETRSVGLNCTEVTCGTETGLIVLLEDGDTWKGLCDKIAETLPMTLKPTGTITVGTHEGSFQMCPVLPPLSAGHWPYEMDSDILFLHCGKEGISVCHGGVVPDEKERGKVQSAPATRRVYTWEDSGKAQEALEDWLGYRPSKHILFFSMADDCLPSAHLPELKAIFRACEALGKEAPQYRMYEGKTVLINRGNGIILAKEEEELRSKN